MTKRRTYFSLASFAVVLLVSGFAYLSLQTAKADVGGQLTQIALTTAARMGDATPTSIAYVQTTRGAANSAAGGGAVDSNQTVYLVTIAGQFIDTTAHTPPGQLSPTGTIVTLVVDANSFDILDLGITNSTPAMAHLGEVHTLR